MYGQVFQDVIADRNELAAYYTKPESAALVASVTVPDPRESVWEDTDAVRKTRVADFACGTGELLQAVYRIMAYNYEAASGKSMRDILRSDPLLFFKPAHPTFQARFRQAACSASHNSL